MEHVTIDNLDFQHDGVNDYACTEVGGQGICGWYRPIENAALRWFVAEKVGEHERHIANGTEGTTDDCKHKIVKAMNDWLDVVLPKEHDGLKYGDDEIEVVTDESMDPNEIKVESRFSEEQEAELSALDDEIDLEAAMEEAGVHPESAERIRAAEAMGAQPREREDQDGPPQR